KKKLIQLIIIISLIGFKYAHAQIKYTLELIGGISNKHGINREYYVDEYGYISKEGRKLYDGNVYYYGPAYGIGASIIEPIGKSKFALEQGIQFEQKSYYFGFDLDNSPDKASIRDKRVFNAIAVPFKVRYSITNEIVLYGGACNLFNAFNSQYPNDTYKKYTLRALLGVDATIFNKYFLGLEYGYDITPYAQIDKYTQIFYHFDVLSFKVGCAF
nr:hypothetical protein [Prolixibacteraceae bacterium]